MKTSMSLTEFIETREAEIKEIRSQLLLELKDLKKAKAAILGDTTPLSASAEAQENKGMTIKEMILSVLRDAGSALTAEDIIQHIYSKFGESIKRSSLSPQLSRLKKYDGKLAYSETDKTWALLNSGPVPKIPGLPGWPNGQ